MLKLVTVPDKIYFIVIFTAISKGAKHAPMKKHQAVFYLIRSRVSSLWFQHITEMFYIRCEIWQTIKSILYEYIRKELLSTTLHFLLICLNTIPKEWILIENGTSTKWLRVWNHKEEYTRIQHGLFFSLQGNASAIQRWTFALNCLSKILCSLRRRLRVFSINIRIKRIDPLI